LIIDLHVLLISAVFSNCDIVVFLVIKMVSDCILCCNRFCQSQSLLINAVMCKMNVIQPVLAWKFCAQFLVYDYRASPLAARS